MRLPQDCETKWRVDLGTRHQRTRASTLHRGNDTRSLLVTGQDLIRKDLSLEGMRQLLLLVGVTVTWLLVRPIPGEEEGVVPAPEPSMIVVLPLSTGASRRCANGHPRVAFESKPGDPLERRLTTL